MLPIESLVKKLSKNKNIDDIYHLCMANKHFYKVCKNQKSCKNLCKKEIDIENKIREELLKYPIDFEIKKYRSTFEYIKVNIKYNDNKSIIDLYMSLNQFLGRLKREYLIKNESFIVRKTKSTIQLTILPNYKNGEKEVLSKKISFQN